MDFQTALHGVKATVDVELNYFFNEKRSDAKRIHPQTVQLVDQIRDLTLRAGKRTRAFLVWLGFQATHPYSSSEFRRNVGMSREAANSMFSTSSNNKLGSAMMALELFQSFALIHDDIIDEDATRRGGPTIHEKFKVESLKFKVRNAKHFGTSMAILAGDLALAWTDECMAKTKSARVLDLYRQMKQEVILGQSLDVIEEHMKIGIAKKLIDVHKTAWYSVIRPLQIGSAIGGLEERFVEALVPYGLAVGEGYQLRDDLLDGTIEKNIFQAHASKLLEQAARAIKKLKISKSATILLTDFARFALKRPA